MIKNKGHFFNWKYLAIVVSSFFLMVFAIFGAFANVNHLYNNIQTNYSTGENIKGTFNLDIANHPADAELTSNFPGNITLLDLIINQSLIEGQDYTCSTDGCVKDYASTGAVSQMTVSEESGFAGFGIDGTGIEIKDFSLSINSNAPASCLPNIYVDLLADGQDILTSTQGNGESCGIYHRGCYNQSNTQQATLVTGKEYCQKINIPAGPSFIIGGNIKRGTGSSNLTMKLYDYDTTNLRGSCKLPQNSQDLEELSCIVNYSSHETNDYYVCITTSSNNNYKIGWETTSPTCGTAQDFNNLNSDFDLFAQTTKYSGSPSFTINQTTYDKAFNGLNLREVVDSYIQNFYNGNCQLKTCFIPIKIYGANQQVSFSNAKITYESVGVPAENEQVYELDYDFPRISAENISIDISKANFVIPVDSNQNKFRLFLDGNELFEKNINLKKSFVFDINPKIVAFGQNVRFTATADKLNITRTIWDFGDGTNKQTIDGNSVMHIFTKDGDSFDVNVTAIANSTQATKQFKVFVGDPRELANITITEYRRRISNITSQIQTYPSWSTDKIKDLVSLNNMTSSLNSIELDYKNSTTEEDYQSVMLDLIKLDVPSYISTSNSGDNLPLSVGYENVNVNYIEQIENKDISDNTALRNQIVAWMNDNFNAQISFKKISRIGDYESETVGTLFTIRTNPVLTGNERAYLIIGQDVSTVGLYKQNYNELSVTSGVDYFILDNSNSQVFEFFVEGDVDAETLGAYISPALSVIGDIEAPTGECNLNNICENGEDANSCPEDCSNRWFKFTLFGWIILIIGAFVAYIILQEWYKRNYQRSLFPNSNDLYNLINFIYNARKSGLDDGEIRSKLRQQKWSNERIRFAFRKINGKRVGMLEIPIFTWREHKKTVNEISKRQPQGAINARFIKRPY